MKKKYQNKTKYNNASDVFVYNTNLYCKLIAKKANKDTKIVNKYFKEYFSFLDELNILDFIPAKRINNNIKNLTISNSKNFNANELATYTPSANLISIRKNSKLTQPHTIIHEFNHMLSSNIGLVDNRSSEMLKPASNKKIYQEKCGFCNFESLQINPNVNTTMNIISSENLSDYIYNNFQQVSDEDIDFAFYWINNFEIEKLLVLSCALTNNAAKNKQIIYDEIENGLKGKYNEFNLILSPTKIINVVKCQNNYKLKEFTLTNFQDYENSYKSNEYDGINEGVTELLALMFATKYNNKDLLSFSYPIETKMAEMMFKVFGNSLFEGYFTNNFKPMENYLGINPEVLENIANNFESIFVNREVINAESEIALLDFHYAMIDLLTYKISFDIINNSDLINNQSEINRIINASILDFSKSLSFGYNSNQISNDSKDEIKAYLADSANECISQLKSIDLSEENDISEDFKSLLTNLEFYSEEEIYNLFDGIEYMNNNLYNFLEKDIKEIEPINYLYDVTFTLRNSNKQDYIRTKNKYMKIADFNNLCQ